MQSADRSDAAFSSQFTFEDLVAAYIDRNSIEYALYVECYRAMLSAAPQSSEAPAGEYERLRGLIERRISGMAMPAEPGPLQECAKCAHSELSDLLAAFDAGENPDNASQEKDEAAARKGAR